MVPISSFNGHTAAVYALAAGPDRTFYSAGGDGAVVEWSLDRPDAGRMIVDAGGSVYALRSEPAKHCLLIGMGSGRLVLVDTIRKQEIQAIDFHQKGIFRFAELADDGLLCAGGDGVLSAWHWRTSDQGWKLEPYRTVPLCEEKLRDIAVNADQGFVACGDGTMRALDLRTFNDFFGSSAHEGGVSSLVIHAAKPVVISGGKDGLIRAWDRSDGREIIAFAAHKGAVYGLCMAPDGSRLISVGRDAIVKAWDGTTLAPLQRSTRGKDGHTHSVNAILGLGDRFITAGEDRRVHAWRF